MDQSRSQTMYGQDPDPHHTPEAPTEAFGEAMQHVGELKAFASHYVSARIDRLKVSARNLVLYAALGCIALLAGAAMIVVAVVQVLSGLAGVIAAGLGGRLWAGNLIIGFAVLVVIGAGAWLGVRLVFSSSRKRTVERYERRLQRQRVDYGADVRQRAQYAATHKS